MSLPTYGDLEAWRLFNTDARILAEMTRRQFVQPFTAAERAEVSDLKHAKHVAVPPPTIMQVLRLMHAYRADTFTPGLDFVWKTKGMAATKADLEAFWEEERKKPQPEKKVEEEKETVNEILLQLREIKDMLSTLSSSKGGDSDTATLDGSPLSPRSDFSTVPSGEGEESNIPASLDGLVQTRH